MSATSAPRDESRPAADAAAAELAHDANVDALARHAAQAAGDGFFARLMAHELVLNHRLVMRFGAMADDHLGHTSPTSDPDRRQVGRDAVQYAAIAARMSERVRQGALTLAKLAPEHVAGGPLTYIVRRATTCGRCGGEYDGIGNGDDPGGGSSGPGSGQSGCSTPPTSAAPPVSNGTGGQAMAAAAGHLARRSASREGGWVDRSNPVFDDTTALRRGRLNNGNPVGDYAKAPRCGARTRDQGSCRQPAMKNGRCRLHGGKSTGPRTAAGLANSRAARRRHGRRTGAIIKLRSAAATHGRRLAHLTRLARALALRQATGAEFQIDLPSPIPAGHGLDRSDWPLPPGPAGFIRSEIRLVPPSGERTGGGHGDVFSKG